MFNINHRISLLGIVAALLIGCSSDEAAPGGRSADANTANHSIYLPAGVSNQGLAGDVDGISLSAGKSSASAALTTGDQDVAGFITERPAFYGEQDASEVLSTFENDIRSLTDVSLLTNTGKQTLAGTKAIISAYSLIMLDAIQPTALSNLLVNTIGIKTVGGIISNLPTPLATEPSATAYTLLLGVIYFSETELVVAAAVVPTELAGSYTHITSGVTSPNNIGKAGATPANKTDSFTAVGGGGLADFLFVIDNSGSMAGEQLAISDAANAFETAITGSGLDFKIGTIMTDRSTLRDTNGDGKFTSDISEFKVDVKPGTFGSGTESGIYFAEQALFSTALGDMTDGSVTTEGYPRAGASLSVIILSDEKDQYTSYAGIMFDTTTNLFVTRNYRVYSIVNVYSQYDDLSVATGGSIASINSTAEFGAIMNNIAANAGGASSQFILSETAISATISVTAGGAIVANSGTNGWTYNAASNSVVFHGTAVPTSGTVIEVNYYYFTP